MKFTKIAFAASIIFSLSACGGGGGGSSTEPTKPPVVTNPTNPPVIPPTVQKPVDPYTNLPAAGDSTLAIEGTVLNTSGSIVTAYLVQADGSNGAAVGTSTQTGPQGSFAFTLSSAATGMIRLVSTGGVTVSQVDGSKEAGIQFEAVIPYITTDTNRIAITPISHLVSRLAAYKAKSGATLNSAFLAATNTILSISAPNIILQGDSRIGITLLKTVPGSISDKNNTYADLLKAIDWYGVRYDIPSSVVLRILASNSEKEFPLSGVDGNGNKINVGKWVQGKFDENVILSLDEITAQRNSDGSLIFAPDGSIIHDYLKAYIATDLMQYFYRVDACVSDSAKDALFLRYPNDVALFNDQSLKTMVCEYDTKQLKNLKSLVATNNRSK